MFAVLIEYNSLCYKPGRLSAFQKWDRLPVSNDLGQRIQYNWEVATDIVHEEQKDTEDASFDLYNRYN